MHANAAVLYEVGKPLVVEDVEVVDPAAHEVRVRSAANGVCPAGTRISVEPTMLLQQRVLTGTSFGGGHQRTDVPLLIDMFMDGKHRLAEMVTRRLPPSELNHAFDLMKQGEVKRSVIVYESS